jgi:hypothetical protein
MIEVFRYNRELRIVNDVQVQPYMQRRGQQVQMSVLKPAALHSDFYSNKVYNKLGYL